MNNLDECVCLICGIKNSGKTTLLEKLIREFSSRGIKTAVIKHDGHDFTCDIPGTDSNRFYKAGAYGTAVFSQNRIFVHRKEFNSVYNPDSIISMEQWERERVRELASLFPKAHLIMVEGLKNTSLPKIEVIRAEISSEPASNPAGRFLIATDHPQCSFNETVVDLDNIEAIADFIECRFHIGCPLSEELK